MEDTSFYMEPLPNDPYIPLSFKQLEIRWKKSNQDSKIRGELLARVVNQAQLQRDCIRQREKFLKILKQSLESVNPPIFFRAVLLISEFINK